MKLTGKSKEDFLKWNKQKEYILSEYVLNNDLISETLINALIIEFFDSVGIFIFIEHTSYFSVPKFEAKVITNDDFIILNRHEKRSEATEKAIEKANFIYNDRFIKK